MTLRSTALRLLVAAVVCALASSALVVALRATGAREPSSGAAITALGKTPAVISTADDLAIATRPLVVRRDLAAATILTIVGLFLAFTATRPAVASRPRRLVAGAVRLPSRRGPPLALPR